MRVAMIGSGYVGLVSGACFADFGHHVACVDKDAGKIAALKGGQMPIYEPGLADLVAANVKAGRLTFASELNAAVAQADAVFIAVGTPSRRGDGHADLSYVYAAAKEIAAALDGFTVVVTKSTVPVGTGDEVERIIREASPDADDARASKVMAELYRPLYLNRSPIITTGRRTAELIKYAANAFLATKITFINEIADLCEKVGADVQEVARGIGLDNRIGNKFLHAGPGYGGSCFPKDTLALIKTGQDFEAPLRIVETVASVNEIRKRAMARKVTTAIGTSLRGKTVAVLGLTFKPNTDDMRDAPSIPLITALHDMGAKVRAYDPVGMEQAKKVLPELTYCADEYECAIGAEVLVICTEWEQFRALDFRRLKASMRRAILVDLRNIYRSEEIKSHGFRYSGIGWSPSRGDLRYEDSSNLAPADMDELDPIADVAASRD
jgi:UDPglucose 6-dehydrogenase